MKLVDILFVLTAAATANAILIPSDNNGSPQASGTSSQVSGPSNEPDPEILNQDWQEVMDTIDPSTLDKDWKDLFDLIDPSTSDQNQQHPIGQPGPSTSDEYRKRLFDIIDSSSHKRGQKRPIDESNPSTSDQNQQHPIGQPGSGISEEYWKRLSDVIDSSSHKRGQKRPINESSSSSSKRSRKQPTYRPSTSTFSQNQQQPMDQPGPSTSNQDQQLPMDEGEFANTVPNQATVLSQKHQRTLNRIKQRIAASKVIREKKWKEYSRYADLGLKQWSGLATGKEISGSKYNPNTENRLKKEYVAARIRVNGVKQQLKRFMERHGLRFEEPKADSD
ncbi:hypothetical protein O5D80_001606 [Batrachochytrium dendrobatidis]|nr:hypothetical protein O5D80_001606 [Batrachochytrium dendrobatidis]